MDFVHLRTHSEFSVVDGTLRIDDMAAAAARDGQGALAITDLGNLFGAVKFYNAARKKGVKPILGADVWLEPEGGEKQPSRLLLLVQDSAGYLNLCELLSRAWLGPAQQAQARVGWNDLAQLGGGLIVLSGAEMGAVGQALAGGDPARAAQLATRLAELFPNRFYLELQRAGLPGQEALLRATVALAAQLRLPVVATHPVQFLVPEDYEAHEARICVAEGETLTNLKRIKRFGREQYFKTRAQMTALFADLPSALRNSVEIAKRCNLTLVLGKPRLPDFPTPVVDGVPMPMEEYFRQLSHEGLVERLEQLYPDAGERELQRQRYVDRLDFEIATILKMGFPGYFLIVADFINWAKTNGCPVGPGRGSGAGSLVAYALKITDLDPLRYNLLFERFLNPERVSMPDFDVDFCQGNRDRVIDYVKQKYGRDAVSQIATFGTMAAKAALRDVGRVLGMGYGHVDSIAKLIPAPPGKTVTLAKVPEKPDPGIIYARREAPELEQQVVLQRVEAGDVERVRHQRAGPRPAPRADRAAVVLCPVDEVGDDQEVAGEAHLQDRVDLEVEPFDVAGSLRAALLLIRVQLREASFQSLVRSDAEVVLHRHRLAVDQRRREVGQLRFAEHEAQVAALRDLHRVRHRARQVREQRLHLRLRLEVLLAAETLYAARVAQHLALGHADARLMSLEVIGREELDRMRRHNGQLQACRKRDRGAHMRLVARQPRALQLDVEPIREQACESRREGLCPRLVARDERLAHRPVLGARQHDQTLAEFAEPGPLQRRLRTLPTLQPGTRQQLAQVQIALAAANERDHTARCLLAAFGLEPEVGADDRLDPRLARGAVELDGAEHVRQVGDRERALLVRCRRLHRVVDAQGAVDDGEFGVGTQVNECHGGHSRERGPVKSAM